MSYVSPSIKSVGKKDVDVDIDDDSKVNTWAMVDTVFLAIGGIVVVVDVIGDDLGKK